MLSPSLSLPATYASFCSAHSPGFHLNQRKCQRPHLMCPVSSHTSLVPTSPCSAPASVATPHGPSSVPQGPVQLFLLPPTSALLSPSLPQVSAQGGLCNISLHFPLPIPYFIFFLALVITQLNRASRRGRCLSCLWPFSSCSQICQAHSRCLSNACCCL